jgi:hypothetical protein
VKSLTQAVEMAKRLRRASRKTGERRSLRKISAELAAAGDLNERGQPLNPNSIKLMLEGRHKEVAKGASSRFTPITDQRYATLLTPRKS